MRTVPLGTESTPQSFRAGEARDLTARVRLETFSRQMDPEPWHAAHVSFSRTRTCQRKSLQPQKLMFPERMHTSPSPAPAPAIGSHFTFSFLATKVTPRLTYHSWGARLLLPNPHLFKVQESGLTGVPRVYETAPPPQDHHRALGIGLL